MLRDLAADYSAVIRNIPAAPWTTDANRAFPLARPFPPTAHRLLTHADIRETRERRHDDDPDPLV